MNHSIRLLRLISRMCSDISRPCVVQQMYQNTKKVEIDVFLLYNAIWGSSAKREVEVFWLAPLLHQKTHTHYE